MRLTSAVVVLVLGLAMTAALSSAPASTEPVDPAAADSQTLGVLAPVSVSLEAAIPRDGLWQPSQGSFLCPDTVCVRDERGKRLEAVSASPQKGQYRVRLDGCIRFASDDASRRVTISYQYRPRRAVVLPVVAGTDYQDAVPTLLETLTGELQSRGFVAASPDDTADALAELRSVAASGPPNLTPQLVAALASKLDAAYVLLPAVDADEEAILAGFQSHTWIAGSGRSAHTVASRTAVHVMNVAVGITAFDGATGETAAQETAVGSKRVTFRQFGPARRSLVRELAGRVIAKWREIPR